MSEKVFFFCGLSFFLFIYLTFDQKKNFLKLVNDYTFIKQVLVEDQGKCTTQWYQALGLEFDVFSAENFSEVIFLMDASYSGVIKDGSYQCLFFQYGRRERLKAEELNPIGGRGVYDPHQHTFSLRCSIPSEAIDRNATKISFLLVRENNLTSSVTISICRSYQSSFSFLNSRLSRTSASKSDLEKKVRRNGSSGIASCTQTLHHDSQFPLWINYHYRMGVEHFYIYDHAPSNETRLHENLRDYVDANIITIIPWHVDQWDGFEYHASTSSWITHQIWSQNDCIRRYGYLHSWILISDVDEYILPMGNFSNFMQMLQIVPPQYCALQILHYGFRGLQNETSILIEDRPKKYVHRNRNHQHPDVQSKNFVRPNLVHYYSVHQVTRAVNHTPVLYANIDEHARLHHYQRSFISTAELPQYVIDRRLLALAKDLNHSITSILSNK